MSGYQDGESAGLFSALKNISATLLASGKTRLELLGNELEEEKLRAIRLLMLTQAMVFCVGVGTLLAVALLTLAFWDNRLSIIGLFAVVFFGLAVGILMLMKRATNRPQQAFAASIAELQEDIRQLKAVAGHDSSPQ